MSLLQPFPLLPELYPLVDTDTQSTGIKASMLRLDQLDPVISGNKIYKLLPYLIKAVEKGIHHLVTHGGPYSNHLHATAFAAHKYGFSVTGILKGKRPEKLSETLKDCQRWGMELLFTGFYGEQHLNEVSTWMRQHPDVMYIPQGGAGKLGISGARSILDLPETHQFDTIMAACGTGTMGAGLALGKSINQRLILISVLKNNFSIQEDICKMINASNLEEAGTMVNFGFHEGGYARASPALFQTMNTFYLRHEIPTDHVYTGKLLHAFYNLMHSGFFKKGESILLIHSGGLQGNRSLKKGELIFKTTDYL